MPVNSELTAEDMRYIIDISRPDDSTNILEEFSNKLNARLKTPDGTEYKPLKIDGGLDYTKEYPDMSLRWNTQIVYHKLDGPN